MGGFSVLGDVISTLGDVISAFGRRSSSLWNTPQCTAYRLYNVMKSDCSTITTEDCVEGGLAQFWKLFTVNPSAPIKDFKMLITSI